MKFLHHNLKKRPPISDKLDEFVDILVDDWAHMHITMESGMRGKVEVSKIAWGAEAFQIQLYGTRGSITCNLEKEMNPTPKLLDGSRPAVLHLTSLLLLRDEKSRMGTIMDCHFAALNHFLHRIVSEDAWDGLGLVPTFEDCLLAERYIDDVLKSIVI